MIIFGQEGESLGFVKTHASKRVLFFDGNDFC